jgi:hypothetical protein
MLQLSMEVFASDWDEYSKRAFKVRKTHKNILQSKIDKQQEGGK